jgi:hypothetical protein
MEIINTCFNPTRPLRPINLILFPLTGSHAEAVTKAPSLPTRWYKIVSHRAKEPTEETGACVTTPDSKTLRLTDRSGADRPHPGKLINTTENENILTDYMEKIKRIWIFIVSATINRMKPVKHGSYK